MFLLSSATTHGWVPPAHAFSRTVTCDSLPAYPCVPLWPDQVPNESAWAKPETRECDGGCESNCGPMGLPALQLFRTRFLHAAACPSVRGLACLRFRCSVEDFHTRRPARQSEACSSWQTSLVAALDLLQLLCVQLEHLDMGAVLSVMVLVTTSATLANRA